MVKVDSTKSSRDPIVPERIFFATNEIEKKSIGDKPKGGRKGIEKISCPPDRKS
jgi:hypothetical protein